MCVYIYIYMYYETPGSQNSPAAPDREAARGGAEGLDVARALVFVVCFKVVYLVICNVMPFEPAQYLASLVNWPGRRYNFTFRWHFPTGFHCSAACSNGTSLLSGISQRNYTCQLCFPQKCNFSVAFSNGITLFSGIFQRNFAVQWYFPKDRHLSSGLLLELSNGISVAFSNGFSFVDMSSGLLLEVSTGLSAAFSKRNLTSVTSGVYLWYIYIYIYIYIYVYIYIYIYIIYIYIYILLVDCIYIYIYICVAPIDSSII